MIFALASIAAQGKLPAITWEPGGRFESFLEHAMNGKQRQVGCHEGPFLIAAKDWSCIVWRSAGFPINATAINLSKFVVAFWSTRHEMRYEWRPSECRHASALMWAALPVIARRDAVWARVLHYLFGSVCSARGINRRAS